jgi:hypothetical protein
VDSSLHDPQSLSTQDADNFSATQDSVTDADILNVNSVSALDSTAAHDSLLSFDI